MEKTKSCKVFILELSFWYGYIIDKDIFFCLGFIGLSFIAYEIISAKLEQRMSCLWCWLAGQRWNEYEGLLFQPNWRSAFNYRPFIAILYNQCRSYCCFLSIKQKSSLIERNAKHSFIKFERNTSILTRYYLLSPSPPSLSQMHKALPIHAIYIQLDRNQTIHHCS